MRTIKVNGTEIKWQVTQKKDVIIRIGNKKQIISESEFTKINQTTLYNLMGYNLFTCIKPSHIINYIVGISTNPIDFLEYRNLYKCDGDSWVECHVFNYVKEKQEAFNKCKV